MADPEPVPYHQGHNNIIKLYYYKDLNNEEKYPYLIKLSKNFKKLPKQDFKINEIYNINYDIFYTNILDKYYLNNKYIDKSYVKFKELLKKKNKVETIDYDYIPQCNLKYFK